MGKILKFIEPEGTLRRKLQASIEKEREKRAPRSASLEPAANEAVPLFRVQRRHKF